MSLGQRIKYADSGCSSSPMYRVLQSIQVPRQRREGAFAFQGHIAMVRCSACNMGEPILTLPYRVVLRRKNTHENFVYFESTIKMPLQYVFKKQLRVLKRIKQI